MNPQSATTATTVAEEELTTETLYTLQASIVEGGVGDEAARASQSVVAVIEVLGEQTLQQLHESILEAIGRSEDLGEALLDDSPHDRASIRRGHHSRFEAADPFDAGQPVGDTAKISVSSLGLETDQSFGYWFDIWDDWHYEISVVAIGDAHPAVSYPRVTRVGDSPPQYLFLEAEGGTDPGDHVATVASPAVGRAYRSRREGVRRTARLRSKYAVRGRSHRQ
jgi:hypothetical protein